MKWMKALVAAAAVLFAFGSGAPAETPFAAEKAEAAASYDEVIYFPSDRYPYTAAHMNDAIAAGHSDVCTIDRAGADQNREESLAGIPTKSGYDRDEWPMAMCEEGGYGADVEYVPSSDNRGAGSWVGNQLEDYPDGTRVLFVVQ
ncbi:NucA/NucB deoxyribonuclease domain-containing protein [Metabacillus sp. GX 13764]|nr:NucA/NucB deoxyribonuclease domain-containing protein [Metabacillus kandeliae]